MKWGHSACTSKHPAGVGAAVQRSPTSFRGQNLFAAFQLPRRLAGRAIYNTSWSSQDRLLKPIRSFSYGLPNESSSSKAMSTHEQQVEPVQMDDREDALLRAVEVGRAAMTLPLRLM